MIFWGRRTTKRRLGRVALFCPIRRGVSAFEAWRFSRVFHIWWAPLGEGTPVFHEFRSEDSDLVYLAGPRLMLDVSPVHAAASLEELVSQTNPECVEHEAELLEQDRQAESDEAGSELRVACIAERFRALEYMYKARGASGHSESISAVLALVTIATTAVGVVALYSSFSWWVWLALTSAALWPILIYRAVVSTKKSGWQSVEPHLLRSLEALHPTEAELQSARSVLRASGASIAGAIDPRVLSMKLELGISSSEQ